MSGHTPGPWTAVSEDYEEVDGTTCRGWWVRAADNQLSLASIVPHGDPLANANIMAAAPDMHEALMAVSQALRDHVGGGVYAFEDAVRARTAQIDAALDKAEGKVTA